MANLNVPFEPEALFDKDIFELLGIENAPQEKKDEILNNMTRTIQNRVIARVLDGLDDASVKEFEKIIDEGDDQKTKTFLDAKGVDLTQITAEEALNYKTEIINRIREKETGQTASQGK